jgi:hypothetical protein
MANTASFKIQQALLEVGWAVRMVIKIWMDHPSLAAVIEVYVGGRRGRSQYSIRAITSSHEPKPKASGMLSQNL